MCLPFFGLAVARDTTAISLRTLLQFSRNMILFSLVSSTLCVSPPCVSSVCVVVDKCRRMQWWGVPTSMRAVHVLLGVDPRGGANPSNLCT